MPANNVDLYAQWSINSYKLTVDPAQGTWENKTETQEFILEYMATKDISVPERVGYNFAGWTLEGEKAEMTSLTETATFTMGTSNAKLTATWTLADFKVTYNGGDGLYENSTEYTEYHEYTSTVTIIDNL